MRVNILEGSSPEWVLALIDDETQHTSVVFLLLAAHLLDRDSSCGGHSRLSGWGGTWSKKGLEMVVGDFTFASISSTFCWLRRSTNKIIANSVSLMKLHKYAGKLCLFAIILALLYRTWSKLSWCSPDFFFYEGISMTTILMNNWQTYKLTMITDSIEQTDAF